MTTKKFFNRRDFLKASAVTIGAAALASCAPQIKTGTSANPTSAASTQPNSLAFWHIYYDDDADKGLVIKDFGNIFESATGIKVELTQSAFTDLTTKMQTVGAAKDKIPDVFNSGNSRAGLLAMIQAGFVQPLDNLLSADTLAQYDPGLLDSCRYNGKLYALPQESQVFGLIYNMKVFQDLGLSEPTTMADLETAMDKMLTANIIPLAVCVGEGGFAAEWLTQELAARAMTQAEMDAISSGKAKFSDKFMVVEQTIERWGKKGYYGPNVLTNKWDPEVPLMYNGKIGMMPMGIFWAAQTKVQFNEDDLKYGIIVPPPLVAGIPDQICGGIWFGVSLNAYSKNLEEGAKLAVTMSCLGFSEEWVRRTYDIPGAKIDQSKVKWTTLVRSFEILKTHPVTWFNVPAQISSDFQDTQTQLIANKITAQQAADKIDGLFKNL